MYKADIFIATKAVNGEMRYGYNMELRGQLHKREGGGWIKGTTNKATLLAINEALGRFKQSCEIHIHSENAFVLSAIEHRLERWMKNDMKTVKGEPIKNEAEWRNYWKLSKGHLIRVEIGAHPISTQIREEIKIESR